MSFKVGVGKSDFEALRKSDNYYVDKTDILYELVEEKDNQVTLFTRPRRFGKTLMMISSASRKTAGRYLRASRLQNTKNSAGSG